MPGIVAWIASMGFAKAAGTLTVLAGLATGLYIFSFEVCLIGAMISLFFAMFGFKLARTGVMFFIALYVICQVLGVAIIDNL